MGTEIPPPLGKIERGWKSGKLIPKLLLPQWIFHPCICLPLKTNLPKRPRAPVVYLSAWSPSEGAFFLNKLSVYFLNLLSCLGILWQRKNLKFTGNIVFNHKILRDSCCLKTPCFGVTFYAGVDKFCTSDWLEIIVWSNYLYVGLLFQNHLLVSFDF